jgi:hypothetical protein
MLPLYHAIVILISATYKPLIVELWREARVKTSKPAIADAFERSQLQHTSNIPLEAHLRSERTAGCGLDRAHFPPDKQDVHRNEDFPISINCHSPFPTGRRFNVVRSERMLVSQMTIVIQFSNCTLSLRPDSTIGFTIVSREIHTLRDHNTQRLGHTGSGTRQESNAEALTQRSCQIVVFDVSNLESGTSIHKSTKKVSHSSVRTIALSSFSSRTHVTSHSCSNRGMHGCTPVSARPIVAPPLESS